MKSSASFVIAATLFGLPACDKTNDVAELQGEASSIASYYKPKVEGLMRRAGALGRRGGEVSPRIGAKLDELRQLFAPAPGRSGTAIEAKAAELAKTGNAEELQAFDDETREKIEESMTAVNDGLSAIENYMAQLDAQKAAPPPAPPAAPPAPPAAATPEPPAAEPAHR